MCLTSMAKSLPQSRLLTYPSISSTQRKEWNEYIHLSVFFSLSHMLLAGSSKTMGDFLGHAWCPKIKPPHEKQRI